MKKIMFAAMFALLFSGCCAYAGGYGYGYGHYNYGYNYGTYYEPFGYYPAQVYAGRFWPGGWYRSTYYGWYRLGYGYEYGTPVVATAPVAAVVPVHDCPKTPQLSAQEVEALRNLLKQLQDKK